MSEIIYHTRTPTNTPKVFNNEWGMSDGYTWTWNNFHSWMQCFDPDGNRITDQLSGYQVRTHIDTASVIPPIYKDVSYDEVLEAHRETLLVNSMTEDERKKYYHSKWEEASKARDEEYRLENIEYEKKMRRIRQYLAGYQDCVPYVPTTDLKVHKAQGRALAHWHKLAMTYVKSIRFTTVEERNWWVKQLRSELSRKVRTVNDHKRRIKEALDFYSQYLGNRIKVQEKYLGTLVGELENNGGVPLRLHTNDGIKVLDVRRLRNVEVVDTHTSHSE